MYIEWVLSQIEQASQTPRRKSAIAGSWKNRLGSTMELTVGDDHRVDGTFHSGVGAMGPDARFHVTGFVEGEAFSFCVDFGRLGSVASWSGHHVSDEDGDRLITLWHLAQRVRDPHDEIDTWGSLTAGSDEFVRTNE
jgi:hypothetical protein